MLTQQEMKEMYYDSRPTAYKPPVTVKSPLLKLVEGLSSNQTVTLLRSLKMTSKKSEPVTATNTPDLFNLQVRVTEAAVSVQCSFPGGQVSGSGDFATVFPLLQQVAPKIQELFEKGGK